MVRCKPLWWGILSVSIGAVYLACADTESEQPTQAAATTQPEAATQPAEESHADIEPEAELALRRMSQWLASQSSFRLHSVATTEQRLEDGQVVQVSRDATITLQRPDKLQAEVRCGRQVRRIWHQGADLTVLDVPANKYVTLATPIPIDDMLDFLADEHGIIVPLDDLLYPDPYDVLTEHVNSGVLVDQQSVSGHLCDHLLFTQDKVDWQIWIDAGEVPVPRRVVITYKDDSDEPQYEAILDQWEFGLAADTVAFTPQLPPNAQRVEVTDWQKLDR